MSRLRSFELDETIIPMMSSVKLHIKLAKHEFRISRSWTSQYLLENKTEFFIVFCCYRRHLQATGKFELLHNVTNLFEAMNV